MNMQEMGEGQPRRSGGLLDDVNERREVLAILGDVLQERQEILAILREALKEADENEERVLDPRCLECTEGSLPDTYEARKCWVHKARKLIGEAQ